MPDRELRYRIVVESLLEGKGLELQKERLDAAAAASEKAEVAAKKLTTAETKRVEASEKSTATSGRETTAIDRLATRVEQIGNSAVPSLRKIAALRAEIDELRRSGSLTEKELDALATAETKLGAAQERIAATRVQFAELNEQVGSTVKSQTLLNDLFDKSRGPIGQLVGAAGLLGAALLGGVAAGRKLAEVAGVDMTLAMELLEKTTAATGNGLSTVFNKLTAAFVRYESQGVFFWKKAKQSLDDLADGFDATQRANQDAMARTSAAAKKAATEAVAIAQEQVALYGRTAANIEALRRAEIQLADTQRDESTRTLATRKANADADIALRERSLKSRIADIEAQNIRGGQTEQRIRALTALRIEEAKAAGATDGEVRKLRADENKAIKDLRAELLGYLGDVRDTSQPDIFDAFLGKSTKVQAAIDTQEAKEQKTHEARIARWLKENQQAAVQVAETDKNEAAKREARLRTVEYEIALGNAGLDALRQQLTKELAMVAKGTAEERRLRLALAQTERSISAQRIDAVQAWGQAAIAVGNAAFKKNKSWAIASAIINTALGITNVWTQPGINYWVALAQTIALAAANAAEIATIRASEPGASEATAGGTFNTGNIGSSTSFFGAGQGGLDTGEGATTGFDRGEPDYGSFIGGKDWGRDMVRHFTRGAAAGAGFEYSLVSGEAAARAGSMRPASSPGGGDGADAGGFHFHQHGPMYGRFDQEFLRDQYREGKTYQTRVERPNRPKV